MADSAYKTFPATFQSKGITARYSDDTLPPGTYLNMDNIEELAENAVASRLGSIIINRTGNTINALPEPVHSVAKLSSYAPSVWRYAGSGANIYRRAGNTQGAYANFASGLSGDPWSWGVYRPNLSSFPYIFFADSFLMLKDNGTVGPQQWGIFQPSEPVQALKGSPDLIILDQFNGTTGDYTFSDYTSPSIGTRSTAALTAAVAVGLENAQVNNTTNVGEFTILNIGGANPETVLSFDIETTQFTATFTHTHAIGDSVTSSYLTGAVASNTTATVTRSGSYNLGTFPGGTATQGADYIGIFLNVDQPNNISQIQVLFDVGDGSFTENYFYKVISPSQYQSSVSGTVTPAQAVFQEVFNETIGTYQAGVINPTQLQTGDNIWSPLLIQLTDFVGVGNADFYSTTGYTFADINAFQIQIVTNTNGGVNVGISDLICFGGAGPDSFAGVSYDWLYTYYNAATGLESNPCMSMANVNPPTQTFYITPRRQPVTLTLLPSTDSQVTNIRIYRRGGTLASNYYRVDQIAANSTTYVDIQADDDIESSDTISFVNDVPVTSTLPVPVSTLLETSIVTANQVITFAVLSGTNISIHQQLTIGADTDLAQEIVIVQNVAGNNVTAWVQNPHGIGEPITAEAIYGQPCNLMAIAYSAAWLAGDPNNPHYLYYSTNFNPEAFGSPNYIEVGTPDDPITAIVPFQGTLYVASREHWYTIAPSQQTGAAPTVYPTSAVHGVVAPHGWVATENEIWHQAIDGIRTFAGGASVYRTQEIEFLFQNNGVTPIVEADPSELQNTTMTYWNNIVFVAYTGTDGARHRINYHTIYKRWRNDDVPAMATYTEPDINALIYGDGSGLIHQDRIGSYDEIDNGGTLATGAIGLNLQTAYLDQGAPKNQKNYNELTIDANTGGSSLTATLLFNDGQISLPIGTFSSTEREKINLNVNAGDGQQAYRASLQITGATTATAILYQADIRGVVLAETRQSFDTYWLKQGTDESKLCKQGYFEYTAAADLSFSIYYDLNPTAGFTFTLPASTRISTRVRFPAVKYRLMRVVATSDEDFQIWNDSKLEVKPVGTGKGYQSMDLVP